MSEIRSESVNFSKKDIAVRIVCVLLIILFVLLVLYVVNTWNRVVCLRLVRIMRKSMLSIQ